MTDKNKHIPQGYKDSPLGIIPKEWEVKRLGDVCDISVGRDVQIEHFNEKATDKYRYPVYSNTVEEKGLYGFYNYEEYSKGKVTVVGRGVGLGTSFARDKGFGAIGRLVILTPKDNLSNHYLENYINNKVHFFVESAAIPQLTGEQIASYKIAIPSLSEQIIIEKYIQLWDIATEKQSALIEKLKLRKRALIQQLLTGKKRLPGFSSEWECIKLGDITERITRKNEENNKNVVTISAQRGFVAQTDFFNKSVASETLDNYFLVYKDEFCYNKSYSNGYPMGAIKRLNSFDKAVVTTLYICFKLKNNVSINIDYFEQYCESGIFNKELVKVANEGGRAHGLLNVTPTDFFNMHMRIPYIAEQNSIATILVKACKEIELAKEKLANLQSQKRGLMQQLLTGKRRIVEQ